MQKKFDEWIKFAVVLLVQERLWSQPDVGSKVQWGLTSSPPSRLSS